MGISHICYTLLHIVTNFPMIFIFIYFILLGKTIRKSPKKGTLENPKEFWDKRKFREKLQIQTNIHNMHLIKWGGIINNYNQSGTIKLVNSCSIDNCIQILYSLYQFNVKNSREFMDNIPDSNKAVKALKDMAFHLFESRDCSMAKEIWFNNMLKIQPIRGTIDLYGGESEYFMDHFGTIFNIGRRFICNTSTCKYNKIRQMSTSAFIYNTPEEMDYKLNYKVPGNCPYTSCGDLSFIEYFWINDPTPFFVYQIVVESNVEESDIPIYQNICGQAYKLYAMTLFRRQHFTTIFLDGKNRYEYDGYPKPPTFVPHQISKTARVSTIWLVKL